MTTHTTPHETILTLPGLQVLLDALTAAEYTVIGPTLRDSAIIYEPIQAVSELPASWSDRQSGGTYRVERRDDEAIFGHNLGPRSWKHYLFPPSRKLFSSIRSHDGKLEIRSGDDTPPPRYAFLGVRACELAAIRVQDRVFLHGAYTDPDYRRRRENALIVAVNCTTCAATCFCVSMGTGPAVPDDVDLALTEITADGEHRFILRAGTPEGEEILASLPPRLVSDEDRRAAAAAVAPASDQTRHMDTKNLKSLLQNNLEHPRWDEVATRCLTCTNCTMVCPTCFCSTVEDSNDLDGTSADRTRRWDSCFSLDFSYIHGGSVRMAGRNRYRHWLTHKLANWHDQFDQSGCVGCGRCIAWCPVGIDLTEEVAAIRAAPAPVPSDPRHPSPESAS